MDAYRAKRAVEQILSLAEIKIYGNNPRDIRVHNNEFYRRVLRQQSIGLGESYMDGWWDCEKLDEFFHHVLLAKIDSKIKNNWKLLFRIFTAKVFNLQSAGRAFEIGERHYDLGNDLFRNMLDKRMVYSCGNWKDAKTLDQAQEDKFELVCRKLWLRPGMNILDIGCGWGSLARYAAEKYKVSVTGITVSKEQVEMGRKVCDGLPVEIRLQDYRDIADEFDRVVSLGMIEHVGYKNYSTYMEVVSRCLKDDGLFLLHTIGGNKSVKTTDPWLNKYIFPNSMLPSIRQISESIEELFVMEDWHNFSADYDKTLMAWYQNFETNWDKIKSNYDTRFFRLWKYYLLSCAGAFRARKNQLWQIVLSKAGIPGGYQSIR